MVLFLSFYGIFLGVLDLPTLKDAGIGEGGGTRLSTVFSAQLTIVIGVISRSVDGYVREDFM